MLNLKKAPLFEGFAVSDKWIVDVLTDLMAYAEKNGLSVTAEQLDDARLIALTEISNTSREQKEIARTYDEPARRPSLYLASGGHA
ncbi:hypothetical protein [Aliiroseovarius marinus]|uniref:hypothetical protein n=1 Tax=Aliiroseovarius marinus TaxID=2500159 RepID=UPI0024943098|nr:hypothetical protein [Aliiroseovarius marinus]